VPVPSATAQNEALKLVKDAYGGQYAEATSSAQKTAFAEKLLQTAKQTDRGTANHYALLRVVWDVATQAGDAKLAIQVVSEIAGSYEINALAAKASTVTKTAESIRSSAQRTALASVALDLVEEAVAADDYDRAKELVSIGLAAARKAQDWQLVKRIVARDKSLKEAAEAYSRVREALAKLDNDPTNPDANQTAGEYFCFVKHDWAKGIPMLALGADEALRALAQKDLKGAVDPNGQVVLGDGWWDLAQSKQGDQKETLLLRAGDWYREAKAKLSSGLTLAKLEARLEEIEKIGRPVTESALPEPKQPKVIIPKDAAEFDGHHYMVFYGRVPSWPAAKQKCEEMGGHLVTIASAEENAFLTRLIRVPDRRYVLVGGVRAQRRGAWSWIDGSDFLYKNWDVNEPKGKYRFLELDAQGKWHDTSESHPSHVGFICEWDQ